MDSRAIEVILAELRADGQQVLIEAGVTLLHEAIKVGLVDILYLTRGTVAGDGNFLDNDLLMEHFSLSKEEIENEERFQVWLRS